MNKVQFLVYKRSHQPPDDHNDDSRQKDQNGYFIDPMHHTEVEIYFLVRIRLAEYPEEIIPHFAHLEELFYLIRHTNIFSVIKVIN